MKLLISGSRSIKVYEIVRDAFMLAQKAGKFYVTSVIHGGANGVDELAERMCQQGRLPTKVVRPDYTHMGRQAPLIRNREMVLEADAVLAIWDGYSNGTKHTIACAKDAKKPLFIVRVETRRLNDGMTLEVWRDIHGNRNNPGDSPGEAQDISEPRPPGEDRRT